MSATATAFPLGSIDAIPVGEGRVYLVDGREVAVFRCRNGEVHATEARCPHKGGPLADGLVGGHSVICPLHGFAFDLRTGEARGHACERLVTHGVTVSAAGEISLDLA